MSNTSKTRCQRHAESTNPTKVNASPAARNAKVPKWVSFGWMSSAGILVTSTASSAALTTIRRPSLVAPESLRWRRPPGAPAVSGAAIPSCYGFVHRLFAPP